MFHYVFFYNYWYIQKHDGQRDLNSQAQKDIFELAVSRGEVSASDADNSEATAQIRAGLAQQIWNQEKGYALGVIFLGFLLKVSLSELERSENSLARGQLTPALLDHGTILVRGAPAPEHVPLSPAHEGRARCARRDRRV